ncbi:NADH dehydrogenase [Sulfobacillus acidophilus TPY]|nr:NADH dehydrogenase [Sulfobacillus acidophilus TPY]
MSVKIVWQLGMTVIGIVSAPFWYGVSQMVKARMQGRRGPGPGFYYHVLANSWRQETLVPEPASFVFHWAPSVALAVGVLAMGLVPWAGEPLFGTDTDNLLLLGFLLALERFWTGLAGIDTAGSFGGLGASRILTVGSGIEPAWLAVVAFVASVSHKTSIVRLMPHLQTLPLGWIMGAFSLAGYGLVLLAEAGRLPVDNPDTHLELTMMHEAVTLEYSGRPLAEWQLAQMVKWTLLVGLIGVIWGPFSSTPGWAVLEQGAEWLVGSAVIGWLESHWIKWRYFQLPGYLLLAAGLGAVAVFLAQGGLD